jgi:hypothetical protein
MSNFYYGGQHHAGHSNLHSSHPHNSGRSRRSTRASGGHQNHQHQKQMRAMQLKKEAAIESAIEQNFRREFEAARSFELEDDEMFCPFHLLTEDDVCPSCFYPLCFSLFANTARRSITVV